MRYLLLLLLLSSQLLARTKPEEELLPIKVNGKIGFINLKGKVVIEPQFKAVGHFVDGLAPARKGGTYGYIDKSGKFVIADIYDYAKDFCEGYGIVYLDGKPQYIDRIGKMPFNVTFSRIYSFRNDRAIVEVKNDTDVKVGMIDRRGKIIIDTIYNDLYQTDLNDSNGELVIATGYNNGHNDNSECVILDTSGKKLFTLNNKSFVSNETNDELLWRQLLKNQPIVVGFVPSREQEQVGDTGQFIMAHHTISGNIAVQLQNSFENPQEVLFGIISSTGKLTQKKTYMKISEFSENRAFGLQLDSTLCIIDGDGKIVQVLWKCNKEQTYDFLYNYHDKEYLFKNGAAIIGTLTGLGVIDIAGRILLPFKYRDLLPTPNPEYYVYECDTCKVPSWGIINITTLTVSHPFFEYSRWDQYSTDKALNCYIDGLNAYIDYNCKLLWQRSSSIDSVIESRDIDHYGRGDFSYVESTPIPCEPIREKKWYPTNQDLHNLDALSGISIIAVPEDTVHDSRFGYYAYYDEVHRAHNVTGVGFKIYIINNSNRDCYFPSRAPINVQARDKQGNWYDLDYYDFACVVPQINVKYLPQTYTCFSMIPYAGSLKTKLRVKALMSSKKESLFKGIPIYSNEFEGTINPGQLWRNKDSGDE